MDSSTIPAPAELEAQAKDRWEVKTLQDANCLFATVRDRMLERFAEMIGPCVFYPIMIPLGVDFAAYSYTAQMKVAEALAERGWSIYFSTRGEIEIRPRSATQPSS